MVDMLDVEINPIGKPRMTQRDKWAKRACVERYYSFKDIIRLEAKKQKFELSNSFKVSFFVPMPASWSKKKKEQMDFENHQQKPDIDNMLKALMDSLLEDDSKVYEVTMNKAWSYEGRILVINK